MTVTVEVPARRWPAPMSREALATSSVVVSTTRPVVRSSTAVPWALSISNETPSRAGVLSWNLTEEDLKVELVSIWI